MTIKKNSALAIKTELGYKFGDTDYTFTEMGCELIDLRSDLEYESDEMEKKIFNLKNELENQSSETKKQLAAMKRIISKYSKITDNLQAWFELVHSENSGDIDEPYGNA